MFCQVRDFWGLCERKFSSKLAWIQIFHPLNIRSMLPVLRNVYISEGPSLECVPSVEEVTLTKFKCSDTLKYYIQDSKEIQEDDYSSHSRS